jgi:peptide/nickel transport system substrate-binding protein
MHRSVLDWSQQKRYQLRATMRVIRFGCLLTLLLAAGCDKSKSSHQGHSLPAPPLVAKCEPGQPGGRFVLPVALGPKTFNPLYALDSASDAVTRLLFGSLINLNWVTQEPGPGLAESWSVDADQKTWTFKLRQGLRWSDGQPLTAEDVAFTWNEIMYNPDYNRLTYDLFRINGTNFSVTNLDAVTVRVVTPEVFAPFLEFFGGVSILPKHVLAWAAKERRFVNAYAPNTPPNRIVGCGPFRVKEFRPGKFTLLERNPEYWVTDRQGRRLPYFDEVQIIATGGPGTEGIVFLSGKCDAFETMRPENFDQVKQASSGGRFQLVDLGVSLERDFLWFNQNTGTNAAGKPIVEPRKLQLFRNKKFHQAISCAIDRERMAREVYQGRAQPIYGFLSAENPKWNEPNIPKYGFDPAKARALMAEIGIQDRDRSGILKDADGVPIEFTLLSNTGNPAREKACVLLQQDLQKLGVKVTYLPLDFRMMVERVNSSFDYECALMGLGGGGVDPASQMNVLKSSEDLHQWFPFQKSPATDWEARIDSLMESQMRVLDTAARKKYFDEVQAILAEQLPMIYTISPNSYAAIRSDVANLRPSVLTPYRVTWNIEELYFKKK